MKTKWLVKIGNRIVARTRKKPRIIRVIRYQTGKRKSLRLDRKRKALAPGKRISRTGRIYWETRRNRSDLRKWI